MYKHVFIHIVTYNQHTVTPPNYQEHSNGFKNMQLIQYWYSICFGTVYY